MDLGFISNYFVPVVMAGCLATGYVVDVYKRQPLGETFINIATFAIDHFSGLAGIITILAVAFGGYKIATLAVAAATLKAKIASEGFFAALGLSPIGLIVAAIAALAVSYTHLWSR